jgi:hypothetical protein
MPKASSSDIASARKRSPTRAFLDWMTTCNSDASLREAENVYNYVVKQSCRRNG